MKPNSRFVIGGAIVGAILGALGGMFYSRRADAENVRFSDVDRSQLFHLGTTLISVLRQIVELSAR